MTTIWNTQAALNSQAAPFAIRAERASDVVAREALLDACFGEDRSSRTCQRLRDGRAPAEGLALAAVRGRKLVGGAALIAHALGAAKACGHRAVILLGDAPYYGRFGFSAKKTGELALPGTFEPERLLALELDEGALDGAWGMIVPTGAPATRPARVRQTARLVPRVA